MDGNQPGVQLIESEEDKKKKAQAVQPGSAFSPTGPSAPSAKPSETQQARATQAAGPTRGTGFTGVGKFLQANVGSRLGQDVAGRVSRAGQEAASRLGQSVGQFQQQLGQQQSQLTQQQQAAKSALEKIASGELTNVSPEQKAAYQSIASGAITAPGGLQDIGGARSQARLAEQMARGTQTAAGRAGLLQQVVGRGPRQYTSGQSDLDALILGQSGGRLAAARRSTAGLERQVGAQERLAEEQARQFGVESKKMGRELTGEASALEKATMSSISKRKEDYEKELGVLYDEIQSEIKLGALSKKNADLLKNLGLDPASQFYGLPLSEIANLISRVPGGDVSLASSATQQEAARLNALKQLANTMAGFSSEELKKVGTTLDPTTGLSVSGKIPEILKTQKEKYEKVLGGIVPGYSGSGFAWDHPILKDPSRAPEHLKGTQPVSFSPKEIDEMYPNMSEKEKQFYRLFMGSGSRGNYNVNYDLMRSLARGELYDPNSGALNVPLAQKLKDYWSRRVEYKGKDGWFGAGIYGPFEGDAARVQALDSLIKNAQKTFQIKE